MLMDDNYYMKRALELAEMAAAEGEAPVGAVIVRLSDGKIVGEGRNSREKGRNALGHAEIAAIDEACRNLGGWRLSGCAMYVTLEPCPMCAGAIIQSRIKEVVYGASDPKGGCVGTCTNLFEVSEFNHHPEYRKGILESECSDLLKHFFKKKRDMKKKQKS